MIVMDKPKPKAYDIMTRGIMTISRDARVSEAIKTMVERRITSLIVESDDGLYGIVTRKDIVNKVIAHRKNPDKVKVKEIMSEPLMVIAPDMDMEDIAMLMAKTDVRRFAVVEEGKLIGVVSNSDILRAYALDRGNP